MIIGIIHHESTRHFLPPLLKSLRGVKYPVEVIFNNCTNNRPLGIPKPFTWWPNPEGGFELGALKHLFTTEYKEDSYFLMQESTLVKDQGIFDIAAAFPGSLAICPGFGSFLGKYRRSVLEEVGIPVPQSRQVAIYYEKYWNEIYMNTEKVIASCDQPLVDTKKFETKFGRKNMVLENKWLIKWKSNWSGFRFNHFT